MPDVPILPVTTAYWWERREETSGFVQFQREHHWWGREHCHLKEKYVNTEALPCSHFVFWLNSSYIKSQQLTWLLYLAVDRAPGCLCVCFLSLFDNILPLWLPLSSCVWVFLWCVLFCCRDCFTLKETGFVVYCYPGHSMVISHASSILFRWPLYLPVGLHNWKVQSWVLGCGLMWWTGTWNQEEAAHYKKNPS